MLSKAFIDAINRSGIKIYELANAAGMTQSQLSQMLNGIVRVKKGDHRLLKIGEILNLGPADIFLEIEDPYLLPVWNVKTPLGLSPVDCRAGGRAILNRTKEMGVKTRQQTFKRDPNFLLCQGACAGISNDGIVRHLWPNFKPQNFVGIVEKNTGYDGVIIMTRGAIILRIPGVEKKHRGHPVYALDVNTFTLDQKKGGVLIGTVRHIRPDRPGCCSVAFKKYDNQKPLNLKV